MRIRKQKKFLLPTRTKQSFKEECNINNIMSKYMKDGLLEHVNTHQGRYEDLPSNTDYHDGLNTLLRANEAFNTLTSAIRKQFNNDPAEFLEFITDPENQDEINALGLGTDLPIPPLRDPNPELSLDPGPEPEPDPIPA